MKTCGHVSSRDKKKSNRDAIFVMRAGLRNNEFCLRGLTCMWRYAELYSSGKNPASQATLPVLEFFSIESSLKAISSDYGSNKERNVHLE